MVKSPAENHVVGADDGRQLFRRRVTLLGHSPSVWHSNMVRDVPFLLTLKRRRVRKLSIAYAQTGAALTCDDRGELVAASD